MFKRRFTQVMVIVIAISLLLSGVPASNVLAEEEQGSTTYDFESKFAAGTILVDGVINEKAWDINLELTQGIVEGTTNSSAKFGTLWDMDYLYVAFDVTDASVINNDSTYPWEDDSVEIYIDGNNSKTYDNHAVQYIFRWNDSTIYKYNNDAATTTGIVYVSKAKEDGSGYIMEIAIPWACIGGLSIEPGDIIGITTHLNDWDDDGLGTDTSVTDETLGYTPNYDVDWQSAANWAEMTLSPIIFEDDCSNLADSGWTFDGSAKVGGYITDNTRSTGEEVEGMKEVAEGQYLLYGDDTGGGADQAIVRYCDIGTGAWELQLDLKVNSLMTTKPGYEIYRGFFFIIYAGGKGHWYVLNNDTIYARTSSGNASAPITVPYDGAFHKWTIRYDGSSIVEFAIDGTIIASFENKTLNGSGVPDLVKIYNESEDLVSGANEVYFDNIKMVVPNLNAVDENILIQDDCSSIVAGGWTVEGGSGTAVLNDTKKADNFYLYSDSDLKDDSTKTISKAINLSNTEKWALDINMQIDSLRWIYDAYKGYYGLNINIANGEKLFKILMTQDGVSVNENNDKAVGTIPFPKGIIGDGEYHKYSFAWDGVKNLIFAIDGVKVGSFTDINLSNTGNFFSIKSDNYMAGDGTAPNQPSGVQEAYIDSIVLTKNITPQWALYNSKVKFINILPESDAENIKAMIVMEEIPEDMINSESYEVKVDVFAKDNTTTPVVTASSAVKGERFVISMPGVSPDVLYTIKAQLIKVPVNVVMNSYERDCKLDANVEAIEKDGVLSGEQDKSYLYTDVKSMAEKSYNWLAGTFSYDNITDYDYVENKDYAGALKLPLTGTGKYAVYVGYVNGTEEFNVSNSKARSNIVVIPERSRTPHNKMTLYGARSMSEVFTTVVDFSAGEEFSIIPKDGAYARIAYIRLKPMTDEDNELWNRESDGINRLVYNNDGFSDFYEGYYSDENGNPDIQNLLDSAINRYVGKNVAALDWSLGTTFALNQPSQYCSTELFENINKVMTGKSKEITDPVKREEAKKIWVRLRSGDELVIKAVLNYINSNTSPLQLLETRGDQLGIDVNVSLRLEAFYDPAGDDRWLNGTDYSKFTRVKAANGSNNVEISLTDENFQDYIINILEESITKYGADGVNLDFNRYPYVVGYELADIGYDISTPDKLYAAKSEVVTKFMRRVRAELPEGTVISARVPINEFGDQFGNGRGYKDNGIDFVSWTMEGLIDILIPSDISYEEFHDLTPFVDTVNAAKEAGKNVTLYCGITNDLGGHDLTKDEEDLINQGIYVDRSSKTVSVQQYRLRALEAFNAGAERIYVFNSWKGPTSLGYIGDKVALEKWYGLAYEAEAIHNLSTVTTSSAVGGTYVPPVIVPPITGGDSGSGSGNESDSEDESTETDQTIMELSNVALKDDVLKQLGITKADDAKVSVQIEEKENGFTMKVIAEANGKSVEVKDFPSYVTVEVPVKENSVIGIVLKNGRLLPVSMKLKTDEDVTKAVIKVLATGEFKYMTPVTIKDANTTWASSYINELSQKGIINGNENSYFNPKNLINRAEFATIMQNALGLHDMESDKSFDDVNKSAWYAGSVNAVVKFRLMSGYNNGNFGPQNYLTREEAMVVLAGTAKMLGMKVTVDDNALAKFKDADSVSSWAKDAAILAVSSGIIVGDGGKLNPGEKITKAEVAKIISEMLKKNNLM